MSALHQQELEDDKSVLPMVSTNQKLPRFLKAINSFLWDFSPPKIIASSSLNHSNGINNRLYKSLDAIRLCCASISVPTVPKLLLDPSSHLLNSNDCCVLTPILIFIFQKTCAWNP